jgi:hypothetical protein
VGPTWRKVLEHPGLRAEPLPTLPMSAPTPAWRRVRPGGLLPGVGALTRHEAVKAVVGSLPLTQGGELVEGTRTGIGLARRRERPARAPFAGGGFDAREGRPAGGVAARITFFGERDVTTIAFSVGTAAVDAGRCIIAGREWRIEPARRRLEALKALVTIRVAGAFGFSGLLLHTRDEEARDQQQESRQGEPPLVDACRTIGGGRATGRRGHERSPGWQRREHTSCVPPIRRVASAFRRAILKKITATRDARVGDRSSPSGSEKPMQVR